jgi:hypothetical protein
MCTSRQELKSRTSWSALERLDVMRHGIFGLLNSMIDST